MGFLKGIVIVNGMKKTGIKSAIWITVKDHSKEPLAVVNRDP